MKDECEAIEEAYRDHLRTLFATFCANVAEEDSRADYYFAKGLEQARQCRLDSLRIIGSKP